MNIRIQKWGNSLALRIPRSFASEAHIEQGTAVDISVKNGKLLIVPASKPAYTLDELLSAVTKKNIHGESDTGKAVGRELW